VSHKPGGRLPLFSARRAVTPATFLGLLYRFCRLVNRGTMGVNSLHKTVYPTVSRLRFEPGRSAPEFSTLTTRLPSHPCYREENFQDGTARCWPYIRQLFFDIFECLINNYTVAIPSFCVAAVRPLGSGAIWRTIVKRPRRSKLKLVQRVHHASSKTGNGSLVQFSPKCGGDYPSFDKSAYDGTVTFLGKIWDNFPVLP